MVTPIYVRSSYGAPSDVSAPLAQRRRPSCVGLHALVGEPCFAIFTCTGQLSRRTGDQRTWLGDWRVMRPRSISSPGRRVKSTAGGVFGQVLSVGLLERACGEIGHRRGARASGPSRHFSLRSFGGRSRMVRWIVTRWMSCSDPRSVPSRRCGSSLIRTCRSCRGPRSRSPGDILTRWASSTTAPSRPDGTNRHLIARDGDALLLLGPPCNWLHGAEIDGGGSGALASPPTTRPPRRLTIDLHRHSHDQQPRRSTDSALPWSGRLRQGDGRRT